MTPVLSISQCARAAQQTGWRFGAWSLIDGRVHLSMARGKERLHLVVAQHGVLDLDAGGAVQRFVRGSNVASVLELLGRWG